MWASSFLATLVLALPPVSASAWRGVVNDWLDNNRFDRAHSCAALVVAHTALGAMSYPSGYTRLFADLRREAYRVCSPGNPAKIRVGMSDAAVVAVAGHPRWALSGAKCWAYTTRRVCFTNSRVTHIQLVNHG